MSTGITTFVLFVIAFSIAFTEILKSSQTSTKTGLAPQCVITLAVAQ